MIKNCIIFNFCYFLGTKLAVGFENGDIHIIDLKTSKIVSISAPNTHKAPVTSIDCHLNNNVIISSGNDGKTIINPLHNRVKYIMKINLMILTYKQKTLFT